MTDLTYCYLHMTQNEIDVIDTLETPEYISGDLSDDEFDIPAHMIPPNPDESEVLPSRVHPSYPYGDPKDIKHPASRPRPPGDPTSRALFEDLGYASHLNIASSATSTFRWRDFALETLLPPDPKREEEKRARLARKMANVAGAGNQQPSVGQNNSQMEDMNNTTDMNGVDQENSGSENDMDEEDEDDDGPHPIDGSNNLSEYDSDY